MTINISDFPVLHHPFRMIVNGSTMCGKTRFVKQLILASETMIRPEIEEIHYYYTEYQEAFEELKSLGVKFFKGMPNLDRYEMSDLRTLIVMDDLQDYIEKNKHDVTKLFTRLSHHGCRESGISVILITHVLFEGPLMKKLRYNSDIMVLFRSGADNHSVATISYRWSRHNPQGVFNAFIDATAEQYGYLLLDSSPKSERACQVRTSILPDDKMVIYPISYDSI